VLTTTTSCDDVDATDVCFLNLSTSSTATLKLSRVIIQDGATTATTDSTRASAAITAAANAFEE
jgi:hypothetical protein